MSSLILTPDRKLTTIWCMRLVVTTNPVLVVALIVAMIFPLMMVEGAVAAGGQLEHHHGADVEQLFHAHGQVGSLTDGATSKADSQESCHHVTAEGACSAHCIASSCSSLSVGGGTDLFTRPASLQHSARLIPLPEPLPGSIQRPPLFIA